MNRTGSGLYNFLFPRTGVHLHTMLVNCGHQTVDSASYRWDGMKRGSGDMVIWQYTLSGAGAFDFGGRTIPLGPGMGFLAAVPEPHCYYLPENSPFWEFIFVTLHGSEAMRIAGECRRRIGSAAYYAPDSPVVTAAHKLLESSREHAINDAYRCSCEAYRFLMLLLEAADNGSKCSDDVLIKMVHDYCLQNISRPVSVDDIAGVAGLSRWHLSRRFRKAYGSSLHSFITETKMRVAVRKLQSSRESVKEISMYCGFDDPGYFCKVFKKFYGATPAEFRYGRHGGV